MSKLIAQLLLACGLALASTSLVAVHAAEPAKAVKSKAKAKAKPAAPAAAPVEEAEPDITDTATVEYSCELGNKLTIYTNEGDPSHIALRWKKCLHRLTTVGTTTGAKRFENANYGLIWIGIPSKGMLLDSKLNRQLANECRTPEQEAEAKKG
jgi:membrane-bound inhibitor of C-type lysozyme